MTDDRRSPSAGWRAVYAEMEVSPSIEEEPDCPDCVYVPAEHGLERFPCARHGASAD